MLWCDDATAILEDFCTFSTGTNSGNRMTDQEHLPSPRRRGPLWIVLQIMLRVLCTLWLGYRARGVDKIPATGGGLFLINHQSFLDPILVALPLSRTVSFLARDSLYRIPVLRWLIRRFLTIPISRNTASSAAMRETVRRMQHGFLVAVFPEGTRSNDGSVGEFKSGFVAIVRRCTLPVYPVGIAGANEALPRGSWFVKPTRVRVVFGDPLTPEEIEQNCRRGREEQMVRLARQRIVACQRLAEEWRQHLPHTPSGHVATE
jgi:1-acyl-sn-glycerol-3-phosphate acyltransferase